MDHLAAPQLGAEERPAKEGNNEKEGNSEGIYQTVDQSYLQGITAVRGIRAQGSKDPEKQSKSIRVSGMCLGACKVLADR